MKALWWIVFVLAATMALAGQAFCAPVTCTINWAAPTGRTATGLEYGLDMSQGFNPDLAGTPGNAAYKRNTDYLRAGIIRYHSASQTLDSTANARGWIISPDTAAYAWDSNKINRALTGAYSYGPAVLMTIVKWPAYMDVSGTDQRLDPSHYADFAAFCADLVRIVNVQQGRHVKYWEVGNELENKGYRTNMAEVARIYQQAAVAMKAVDPAIKVGGPATGVPQNTEQLTNYISTAHALGAPLGFVSYHQYPDYADKTFTNSDTVIWNQAAGLGAIASSVKSIVDAYYGTPNPVEYFLDEYNINWTYNSSANPPSDLRMQNMKGAIWDALAMISIVNSDTTGGMAWNEASTTFGKLDDDWNLRPAAHIYRLFNEYQTGDVVTTASSDDSKVVVFAQRNGFWRRFCLVNRSDAAQTVQLSFAGWEAVPGAPVLATEKLASSSGVATATVSFETLTNSAGVDLPADTVAFFIFDESTNPAIAGQVPAGDFQMYDGQDYTLSVEATGARPLHYQWFTNGAPDPALGTNSDYPLTHARLEMSGNTYFCVVTNAFGAATSSPVTLTVLAPPANDYAKAVLALGPAGYWPLQETSPPAAAILETNLGALGPTANAYYANSNPGGVSWGFPGALAGDSDTAVAFTSAADSMAFVPRTSPALTLVPPFTLELWINPPSTNYGVVLGEGGGAPLNGGPTYGGFQMAWAGANQTRFEMQLYHYGLNAYGGVHTSSGYALNTWYHYAVTYDTDSNVTLYINGQPAASGTLAYVPDTWSPLTIGDGKWNGLKGQRPFTGGLDEVAVYTNLLSPSAIQAHYAAGTNAAPTLPYEQVVLNDHPILFFRMDNPGGPAAPPDSWPVALNYGSVRVDGAYPPGTVPGAVPGPPILSWGPGGVACPINGVISCVDAGYDPAFDPAGTQPFSAMIWFKGNPADSSMQTLMGRGANSWALNLDGSNGTVVWNSGAGTVASTNVLNDGQWHQAVGVYDGNTNALYIDGVGEGSAAATNGVVGNANDVFLGGDPACTAVAGNERYFGGDIAQAAFFTNALTAAQVQHLFNVAGVPVISITPAGDRMKISYTGTLMSATNVTGPYLPVTDATNPCFIAPAGARRYYRAGNP